MSTITVRRGEKKDLPSLLSLVKELALFEKAPEEVTNTLSDMERDGFGEKPVFGFHVAEVDKVIVGIALYFVKYSTWKGAGLYLDDLIVTEKMRGQGIGQKLFDAYMDEAKKINAKQVHWQVLDWNTPAIDFYKKLGAKIDVEWLDCKMTEAQINKYNSK
ncbi:MAG: GNAT family N-acetyltransferase [Bacteroidetes bacterium]|nr:GNAT family N-acetyltransferase [Bacteroidota bacterium]